MARFNQPTVNRLKTKNYENATAFLHPSKEQELFAAAATTILHDTFYESWKDREKRLSVLVAKCSYRFVADLAYYLRTKMNLRSIPLWLMFEKNKTSQIEAADVARVIQRADEITEFLALYQSRNKTLTPLPSAVRNGIRLTCQKFNAYQFRKYNRGGIGAVTFQQVMRMCRPKPVDEKQSAVFWQIAKNQLPPIETWETVISAAGEDLDARRAAWEKLIAENKVPYMALLRNLRNIIEIGVSYDSQKAITQIIENPTAVRNSRLFPFRWFAAYLFLTTEKFENAGVPMTLIYAALEKAMKASASNMLGIEMLTTGKNLIACDVSGSMNSKPLSAKGKIFPMDVGLVLGHLCSAVNDQSIIGRYANAWETLQPSTILADSVRARTYGGATYTHNVIEWALKNDIEFDRIFLFTDNQAYGDLEITLSGCYAYRGDRFLQTWNRYNAKYPKTKLYMFDLMGYSTTPLDYRGKNILLVSGWSENIFHVVSELESGKPIAEIISQIS